MDKIAALYQHIKEEVHHKLTSQGYGFVHHEENDLVYGSRYIIWSNNQEAIRLLWDGMESWFSITVTSDIPLTAHTVWQDVLIRPFKPEFDNADYRTATIQAILQALNA